MKIDEYFFHQCVKVLFDFFKRFLNGNVWKKFLYTFNTQLAWEVTLYCGVACVLGMVKFTISAQWNHNFFRTTFSEAVEQQTWSIKYFQIFHFNELQN